MNWTWYCGTQTWLRRKQLARRRDHPKSGRGTSLVIASQCEPKEKAEICEQKSG
jgi:hypothetical protein